MIEFMVSTASSVLGNVIPGFLKNLTGAKRGIGEKGESGGTIVNNGQIQNNTTNISTKNDETVEIKNFKFKSKSDEFIKNTARVLFVDDKDMGDKIRMLHERGWQNVSQIDARDIVNTTSSPYQSADIVFVDYDGIGQRKSGSGLSILHSLIDRHGCKKFFILFSAHLKKITLDKLDVHHLGIKHDSGWMQLTKGAPDYDLESKLIHGLKQIEI